MADTKPEKYFIYARKSEESDERQVQSIPDQVDGMEDVARQHGLVVADVLTEEKSAKEPYCRPVFDSLLKRIKRGEATGILVWHPNRLARNQAEAGQVEWLLSAGVIQEIRTPERSYLPSDNVLLLSVEMSMATQYSRDLSKGVKRGLSSKAERGWRPGIAPLGYLNTKTQERGKNTIIPDPDRFDEIRHAWDLMLTGAYLPREILEELTAGGLRTPKRNKVGGGPLNLSTLYKIFNNPFYMGVFTYVGKVYQGKHKPMVTPSEFDRVQRLLGHGEKPKPQRHAYTYAGIFSCSDCAGQITPTTITKRRPGKTDPNTYVYYYCHRARRTKGGDCTETQYLNEENVTGQLLRDFERLAVNKQIANWGIRVLHSHLENDLRYEEQQRESQKKALAEAMKQRKNLNHMRIKDMITDEEYSQERKRIDLEIAKLKRRMEALPQESADLDATTERALRLASHLPELLQEAPEKTRTQVLKAIYSNRQVKAKNLALQRRLWIERLGESSRALKRKMQVLEPQKEGSVERQSAPPAVLIPQLCGLVNQLQTALRAESADLEIPDLDCE